jgi:hypothetical protein
MLQPFLKGGLNHYCFDIASAVFACNDGEKEFLLKFDILKKEFSLTLFLQ